MGSVELLSVPFALYGEDADADPENELQDLKLNGNILKITNNEGATEIDLSPLLDGSSQTLADVLSQNTSAGGNRITDLADPVEAQDAATKAFVEALKTEIFDELLAAGLNGVVFDIDGNAYKTVQIGTQVWMAENLITTKFNDGTPIPLIVENQPWDTRDPAYYRSSDILSGPGSYQKTYAALYNGYTVNVPDKNVCPTGWHVSTEQDWITLVDYLGNGAANKLKEIGTIHWLYPSGATNETGFTALPDGRRNPDGIFDDFRQAGYWWTSTYGTKGFYYAFMFSSSYEPGDQEYSDDTNVLFGDQILEWGFSIRCVKD